MAAPHGLWSWIPKVPLGVSGGLEQPPGFGPPAYVKGIWCHVARQVAELPGEHSDGQGEVPHSGSHN